MLSFFRRTSCAVLQKGLTLIELMVTITIFTIITGVILINNQQFNGGIVLTNLAYEVALTIRQAQVYGLGAKGSGGTFSSAYGVFLDDTKLKEIVFFIDLDGNKTYSGGNEAVQIVDIKQGNEIKDFCITDAGVERCIDQIDKMTIRFVRPNPDSYFWALGGATVYEGAVTKVKIVVWSPQTQNKRRIVIENTGQISVGTES